MSIGSEMGGLENALASRHPFVLGTPNLRGAGDETYQSEGDLSFRDFLDVINPLQHIPGISTVYRTLTGDTIAPAARALGGAIYGGPIGLLAGVGGAIIEQSTGADPGAHMMALLTDPPASKTGAATQAKTHTQANASAPLSPPASAAAAATTPPATTPAAAEAPPSSPATGNPSPATASPVPPPAATATAEAPPLPSPPGAVSRYRPQVAAALPATEPPAASPSPSPSPATPASAPATAPASAHSGTASTPATAAVPREAMPEAMMNGLRKYEEMGRHRRVMPHMRING